MQGGLTRASSGKARPALLPGGSTCPDWHLYRCPAAAASIVPQATAFACASRSRGCPYWPTQGARRPLIASASCRWKPMMLCILLFAPPAARAAPARQEPPGSCCAAVRLARAHRVSAVRRSPAIKVGAGGLRGCLRSERSRHECRQQVQTHPARPRRGQFWRTGGPQPLRKSSQRHRMAGVWLTRLLYGSRGCCGNHYTDQADKRCAARRTAAAPLSGSQQQRSHATPDSRPIAFEPGHAQAPHHSSLRSTPSNPNRSWHRMSSAAHASLLVPT